MLLGFLFNRLENALLSSGVTSGAGFTEILAIEINAIDPEGNAATLTFPRECGESGQRGELLELYSAAVDEVTDGTTITGGKIWFQNGGIAQWVENELVTQFLDSYGQWDYTPPTPAVPCEESLPDNQLSWLDAYLTKGNK